MAYRVYRLGKRVYAIRVFDSSTRFFEGLWEIPEGVTYNAYLIAGEEATVLLDTVKAAYTEELLEALESIASPRDIDAIIVSHAEPDHSGAFPTIYRAAGKPVVYASPAARAYIESRYGLRIERFEPIAGRVEVALGGGESLEAVHTPWLHWPDTIMTLYKPHGILFSGDAFGSYGLRMEPSDGQLDESGWSSYKRLMVKYFATVIGSYRGWVTKALDRLSSLGWRPSTLAPLHGLIVEKRVGETLELYQRLASSPAEPRKATIVYTTMYGLVERAALAAAEALAANGYRVYIHGFNDAKRPLLADVVTDTLTSEILVFATHVYEHGFNPIAELLANLLCTKASAGQKTLLIVSYSWSPRGKQLADRLSGCGFRLESVIEARGGVDPEEVRKAVVELLEAETR